MTLGSGNFLATLTEVTNESNATAYLHRKEGDDFNAGYWYRRASKTPCRDSLDREWAEITEALLRTT